jgi:hypothetical protein
VSSSPIPSQLEKITERNRVRHKEDHLWNTQADQTMPLNDPEPDCSKRGTSTEARGLPATAPSAPDNNQLSKGDGNVLMELEIALSSPSLTPDIYKYLAQKRFQCPTKMDPGMGNTARQVHCSLQSHPLKVTTGVSAPQTSVGAIPEEMRVSLTIIGPHWMTSRQRYVHLIAHTRWN